MEKWQDKGIEFLSQTLIFLSIPKSLHFNVGDLRYFKL